MVRPMGSQCTIPHRTCGTGWTYGTGEGSNGTSHGIPVYHITRYMWDRMDIWDCVSGEGSDGSSHEIPVYTRVHSLRRDVMVHPMGFQRT